VAQTVSKALVMAEALGIAPSLQPNSQKVVSFLTVDEIPDETSSFSGDDIITTLEDLKKAFKDQKDELLEDHTKDKQTFESEKLDFEQKIKLAEDALDDAKKKQSRTHQSHRHCQPRSEHRFGKSIG
jgi:predicted Zn-dependent protease